MDQTMMTIGKVDGKTFVGLEKLLVYWNIYYSRSIKLVDIQNIQYKTVILQFAVWQAHWLS
jgi:hypothetical protein